MKIQKLEAKFLGLWGSLILSLGISSCASVDYGLYRIGATEEDFHLDETECRQELGFGGRSLADPTRVLTFLVPRYQEELQTCLREKGWKPRL